MSCLNQYPQYLICTPRQDKFFIHRENIVAYIHQYNNEYLHTPSGQGSAQGNTSNWRTKQNKFPAVTNLCTLINSQENPLSYVTAKTITTVVPN
jgi:hypothetical protein